MCSFEIELLSTRRIHIGSAHLPPFLRMTQLFNCVLHLTAFGRTSNCYNGKYAVPMSLVQQLILPCHSYMIGGLDKTLLLVDREFYFHGFTRAALEEQVKEVFGACAVCQHTKPHAGKQLGSVNDFPVPSHLFSSLSINVVDVPQTKHNTVKYDYCMVVVCRPTGYVFGLGLLKVAWKVVK